MLGGKGAALWSLEKSGFPVPAWLAVLPGERVHLAEVRELNGSQYAVRSSAWGEDGESSSFAGQLESYLRVELEDVPSKVEAVRASAGREHVRSYQAERGFEGALEATVLVQRMIDARVAGVAFSADPVSGRRDTVVVSAVEGTAEALVSGVVDGEFWKWRGHWEPGGSLISEGEADRILDLVQKCEAWAGRPQDIEWAIDGDGKLWLLQSRAITTLSALPDPGDSLRIWDNSNIAESYGGVTTALTFSFARKIYEHVYREFCGLMRVPRRRMSRADEVFPQMLGMVEGRVYYQLLSWYRVLAMLPGFSLNRSFMEQMMGVKEALPEEVTARIADEGREGKWRDAMALVRTLAGLVKSRMTLKRRVAEFRQRLDEALLPPPVPFERMSGEELVAAYRKLEGSLLKRWDAPLVNDFLAMLANGVLRKMAESRGGVEVANRWIADCGEIISAEPPRRIREMGEMAAKVEGLTECLVDPERDWREKRSWLRKHPPLRRMWDAYEVDFGDRCLEELKLESPTLEDDPGSLLASIGAMAQRYQNGGGEVEKDGLKLEGGGWWWNQVVGETRARVRDRENLRFERTRLFGRVRKIVRELGKRLHADGQLGEPTDVFHLEIEELMAVWEGTRSMGCLSEWVAARKSEYERCLRGEAPPDRFETRGPLHRYVNYESRRLLQSPEGTSLQGTGACAGRVQGRVRVVDEPRNARLEEGEILVARQTDPGWVVLFPQAAGLLVERGSVLSHSAIVSRELGLPCVVGLSGVMGWIETGDVVEMDGGTGLVTKIRKES
ncbi:pyruvate,water dikinase [Haloferula luteola]|uniref:Pyruvate,water dikinase n=2 Tax=Haloferula luteola TaxID=595692 RepID=A0A840V3Y7_9BACT|nr:pyruvate,water dikinase [Haloferula luteola]